MASQFFDLVDDLDLDPPKRDAIEQGVDFSWPLRFFADDVDGTDISDWLVRMQIRRTYADKDTVGPLVDLDSDLLGGIVLEVGVTDEAIPRHYLGITAMIDDADTQALKAGFYKYDMEVVRLADDYKRRILEGAVQVRGEVTRANA